MWHRLASLWGCTVREAQSRCDSQEFCNWRAFWNIEPWGATLFDRLFANLAMHLDDKPGVRKLSDYLCIVEPEKPKVSLQERKAQADAFFGSK